MMVVVFCLFRFVVNRNHQSKKHSASFFYFGNSYQMMMGENIEAGNATDLDWVIYFMYTTLINIIALNLLISIIAQTFADVLERFEAT